jgi:hypothetical protein
MKPILDTLALEWWFKNAAVALFITQLAATLYMTGLIWFVQVVHYPLFNLAFSPQNPLGFVAYANQHSMRTTWVVAPAMLVEFVTAAALVLYPVPVNCSWAKPVAWFGFGLVVVLWLATAFLSVPQHHKLATGFNANAYTVLVSTNWVRTAAWSLRSGLLLALLARCLRTGVY